AGQFKVVGNTFSEENYGVGLPKGSTALCEQINTAITSMVEDGTWEQLLATHAGEDYQYNTELNPPTPAPCQ
ncbi:MAG: transporter substrate-binding domain-containing protein, partial [Actinomycetes bacterium]|nr:transporter substrate-binding domain-containing protein [Actinomycetes bacterium]